MKNALLLGASILVLLCSCKKNNPKPVPLPVPAVYHKNGEVNKLYYNSENAVNIVVLGDGFIKEDLVAGGAFDTKAKDLVDYLFTVAPFSQNKQYFNTYLVYSESQSRGASKGFQSGNAKTKFSSYFSLQTDRLLVTGNYDSCYTYVQKALPLNKVNLVVLLVNDETYGGSGGSIAVVSAHPLSRYVMVHETGHTFAGLGDEYIDPAIADNYPLNMVPFLPNVDNTNNPDQVKWKNFYSYPAYNSYVSAYQGAYYRANGLFRPELQSTMSNLNYLNFNGPSREAIVKRIRQITQQPFDAAAFFREDGLYIKPIIAQSGLNPAMIPNDFIGIRNNVLMQQRNKQELLYQINP